MMPSPRSSPAVRPTSPLSPRYESTRFESLLQPPSSRSMQTRSKTTGRRTGNTSLMLPSLPRFHPANYPSAHSSYQNTPEENGTMNDPMSPRTHQKMYSDTQKHLLLYHRENVAATARASSPLGDKPISPRLLPLGSPGPVTPLELEGEDEYLVAGARNQTDSTISQQELMDKVIGEESRRAHPSSQSAHVQRSLNRT